MSHRKLPGIGLRNIKTAISTMLCAVIYAFIGRNPTFACIGAVFGMDNNIPNSWRTGGNRLVGTIIGGFLGMGFFYIATRLHNELVNIILLGIGMVALIYISQLFYFHGAIQAGSVVFFIVMLNTPENQYISYALNRMLDTGIGVIISVIINYLLPRELFEQMKKEKKDITERERLEEKINDLVKPLDL